MVFGTGGMQMFVVKWMFVETNWKLVIYVPGGSGTGIFPLYGKMRVDGRTEMSLVTFHLVRKSMWICLEEEVYGDDLFCRDSGKGRSVRSLNHCCWIAVLEG